MIAPWIRRLCFLLAFASAGLAHAQAGDTRTQTLDRIVAVVNDEVITQSELEQRLRIVKQQLAQNRTQMPPDEILRKQVLDRMVAARIQLQLAARNGIRVDDDTLNRAISRMAADNQLSVAEFRSLLEQDGYDFTQFREDMRDEIIIARLTQRQVTDRINVSQQEIDNYLTSRQALGDPDAEYHLAHILIATPSAATPEDIQAAKAKAEKVLTDLRAGADFHQTAVAVSDGQQALQGGDLEWRKVGELPSFFVEAVPRMEIGQTSNLIRSTSGFHILKLLDKRSSTARHIVTQTHARHILIKPDDLTSEQEAQRMLVTLRERALNGEDFATLAKGSSQDKTTAPNGGDLGWVSPGELVPQFELAMDALEPQQISDPFETGFGWHIVQVLERRAHDETQQVQQAQAREAIRQRKIDEEQQAWLQRLRDEAYVEYRLEG